MNRYVVLRVVAFAAVSGLIIWLVVSGTPNRWTGEEFVRQHIRPLNPEQHIQVLREVEAVARIAGIQAPVNLNAPWKAGALNLYVTSNKPGGERIVVAGDARYVPGQNLFLVDEGVVWPSTSENPFAGLNVSEPGSSSGAARLWFQLAMLHEIGHFLLHRDIHKPSIADAVRIENEADEFAFNKLALLLKEGRHELLDEEGLFSYPRIKALPESERPLATIAAIVQSFSVNLLFSETTFSSYHSDSAHKSFVARFKPFLGRMITEAKTREGKTFLLLALASIERVAAAGERITKEIRSELPIEDLTLTDTEIVAVLALKDGTHKQISISLESVAITQGAHWLPAAIPQTEADATSQPHNSRANKPHASPMNDVQSDNALTQQLSKIYGLENAEQKCQVTRTATAENMRDVLFSCNGDYFSAQYDSQKGQLIDVKFILGPQPREGDVVQLVDTRISGERQTYFFVDSLSDKPHTHPHAITVLRSELNNIRTVAQMDLVTDWIPSGAMIMDWFRVSHPPTLFCKPIMSDIVCVEYLDSIFRFSPTSSQLSVLFYPAGAKMRVNSRGIYAFFASGGHRAFLAK